RTPSLKARRLTNWQPLCSTPSPPVWQSPSASWLEDPLSPVPASESWTLPQPLDPAAPLWLLGQSTSSARFPCPFGSTMVNRRPSVASDSSGCTLSLQLCQAPPSLRLHLSPLLLQLHHSLPDSRLHLGRLSHLFHLSPPDPPHHPGSSALRLRLRLRLLLLHHQRLAPWSRQPFLHHGSSLHRLHCGSPSWLWPGSRLAPPAPSPSCLLPGSSLRLIYPSSSCFLHGSSLHRLHPGLCLPSSDLFGWRMNIK
ncbi:hypothetical protein M9458_035028, partial [Cirrhinus mrigala]